MVEQATKVVSRVVELTNDAWSRALHLVQVEDHEPQHPFENPQCLTKNQVLFPVVDPPFVVVENYDADVESDESESTNSIDKATHIVDHVFGEVVDRTISSIARKKQRMLKSNLGGAMKE
jgi:hypothetical protein